MGCCGREKRGKQRFTLTSEGSPWVLLNLQLNLSGGGWARTGQTTRALRPRPTPRVTGPWRLPQTGLTGRKMHFFSAKMTSPYLTFFHSHLTLSWIWLEAVSPSVLEATQEYWPARFRSTPCSTSDSPVIRTPRPGSGRTITS